MQVAAAVVLQVPRQALEVRVVEEMEEIVVRTLKTAQQTWAAAAAAEQILVLEKVRLVVLA